MNKMVLGLSLAALLIAADGFGASTFEPNPADGYVGDIKIDTSEDVIINSSTMTQSGSTSVGVTGNSSIEKRGTGTLTVNGMHSFTGNIDVYGGTYKVGDGTTDKGNARNSQLGDPRSERTITVYTNGTLQLARTGTFGAGTSSADVKADVEIRGGTLTLASGTCTCFGNLLLHNATVNYGNGAGNWPTFCFGGSWLEFAQDDPSKPYVFDVENGWNTCGFFFSHNTPVDIRVPDITGDAEPDVTFNCRLKDIINSGVRAWACTTNFVKTGSGTLRLGSTDSNFIGDVVVSNGTLQTSGGKAKIGTDIATSVLGDSSVAHTIFVEPNATLQLMNNDTFGQFYADVMTRVHVRGGALKQDDGLVNGFGPLILENATVEYSGTKWGGEGLRWPTFGFSDIVFKGDNAYDFPETSGSYFAMGLNRMAELRVEDIVSGGKYDATTPDVNFNLAIKDSPCVWQGHGPMKSSIRKTGPGVLKFNKPSATDFSGDLEVAEGVLQVTKLGTQERPAASSLGNLQEPDHTIKVCDKGEIYIADSDSLGQLCADMAAKLVVSNGTVRFKSGTCNGLPALELYDPKFIYENGSSSSNGAREQAYTWGLWAWRFPVSFDGTRLVDLSSHGSYNTISLGYSSDFTSEEVGGGLTYYYGRTEIKVADITEDAAVDVIIGHNIQSLPSWNKDTSIFKNIRYRCGLLKTGAGTLRLDGEFACPQPTRIKEGALVFNGTLREQQTGWGKSVMKVENGARLGGSGTVDQVVIEEGGGFTSVPGQTVALTTGSVTLPDSKNVVIDIACTNDLTDVQSLEVPVVAATGLSNAKFKVLYNGSAEPPKNFSTSVREKDGIIYGRIAKNGLVLIFR